jgi:hypothetical protein
LLPGQRSGRKAPARMITFLASRCSPPGRGKRWQQGADICRSAGARPRRLFPEYGVHLLCCRVRWGSDWAGDLLHKRTRSLCPPCSRDRRDSKHVGQCKTDMPVFLAICRNAWIIQPTRCPSCSRTAGPGESSCSGLCFPPITGLSWCGSHRSPLGRCRHRVCSVPPEGVRTGQDHRADGIHNGKFPGNECSGSFVPAHMTDHAIYRRREHWLCAAAEASGLPERSSWATAIHTAEARTTGQMSRVLPRTHGGQARSVSHNGCLPSLHDACSDPGRMWAHWCPLIVAMPVLIRVRTRGSGR